MKLANNEEELGHVLRTARGKLRQHLKILSFILKSM